MIANAYLADPEKFTEMISDLSSQQLEHISRGIAYALYNTNRARFAVEAVETDDPAAQAAAQMIYDQCRNRENRNIDVFFSTTTQNTATTYAAGGLISPITGPTITIGATTADVSNPIQCTVRFTTDTVATNNEVYTIRTYKRMGDTIHLASVSYATVAAFSNVAFASYQVAFSATGVYTLYAEVYHSTGSLVATTADTESITVSGRWHITVELPENRELFGILSLYNASGTLIHTCICLGLSDTGADPSVFGGNTPTGECTGYLAGPDANTYSYGPYKVIILIPQSGQIKELYDRGDRSGIVIHGGDPADVGVTTYPLRPTNGCIRITNADQLTIQTSIEALIVDHHYQVGNVSITEVSS